jgi:hypothetical protein
MDCDYIEHDGESLFVIKMINATGRVIAVKSRMQADKVSRRSCELRR